MTVKTSRRGFMKTAGAAAWAAGGLAAAAQTPTPSSLPQTSPSPANGSSCEAELTRRAQAFLPQRHLVVDYYRIRRTLAYPLPLTNLSIPNLPVGLDGYPWATWMTWALEERLYSLGAIAQTPGDEACRQIAARDLLALSQWPEFRQFPGPDLSSAHAGRLLWTACTDWTWPDPALRTGLQNACERHADDIARESEKRHGMFQKKEELLAVDFQKHLANIPLIGTIAGALTAHTAAHPAAPRLHRRVQMIYEAILDARNQGFSEGVAYDGYVLDFLADWLRVAPVEHTAPVLAHPRFNDLLLESYALGAPGRPEFVAELSDVEPLQMPFHLAALAKLNRIQPHPVRAWHLRRCPLSIIPAAGLAALRDTADAMPPDEVPAAGALDARYAIVLRSGWNADDIAIAVSCTNSTMSHIQKDNGSLVLGTQGRWIITDPGYQQYVPGEEREYTIGPAAHNAPVINGFAQDKKNPRRILLEDIGPHYSHTAIDLTQNYPENAQISSIVRHVWRAGNALAVVADQINAPADNTIAYHWHADPHAAWAAQNGWILLHLPQTDLWCSSPQIPLATDNIQRLPGSRGPLTLVAQKNKNVPVIWWIFILAPQPPTPRLDPDALGLSLQNHRFELALRDGTPPSP